MIFFDVETYGLAGPCVLIQWKKDYNKEVVLHHIWNEPVNKTLHLIEAICDHKEGIVGFNLTFDWFQLTRIFNMLQQVSHSRRHERPQVYEIYELERKAITNAVCLKPQKALDLMLHARKGPYQNTMARKEIRIRRVPYQLASALCTELDTSLRLPDLFFCKRSKGQEWVIDSESEDKNFPDIILRFASSSALKNLAIDAGLIKEAIEFPAPRVQDENLWQPWGQRWCEGIIKHIVYWSSNETAKRYAIQDVEITEGLYKHFDCPPLGDVDSTLACSVGTTRYAGFNVDLGKASRMKQEFQQVINQCPVNHNSPNQVMDWLKEVMTSTEGSVVTSTDKDQLESIEQWEPPDGKLKHPAAERASQIIKARKSGKRIQDIDKLLIARRFHPDFSIIGARSGRMAGAGDFNAQGIAKAKGGILGLRELFRLANQDEVLSTGDFDAFEVTILDAVFDDPELRKDLKSGVKLQEVIGSKLYDIGIKEVIGEQYEDAKAYMYAGFYGGQTKKLAKTAGVTEDKAEQTQDELDSRYTVMAEKRKDLLQKFCSMQQPGGIGTRVEWHEPSEYSETIFGFRRYFTLEHRVCKRLFELASTLPDSFKLPGLRVRRRDREQTASGAVSSALYAAAFNIQAQNMRAAGNHIIQGPGAEITKRLQRRLWDFQPQGINPFRIKLMNIHDEVVTVHRKEDTDVIKQTVEDFIEEMREFIPLISMTWKTNLTSWAMK